MIRSLRHLSRNPGARLGRASTNTLWYWQLTAGWSSVIYLNRIGPDPCALGRGDFTDVRSDRVFCRQLITYLKLFRPDSSQLPKLEKEMKSANEFESFSQYDFPRAMKPTRPQQKSNSIFNFISALPTPGSVLAVNFNLDPKAELRPHLYYMVCTYSHFSKVVNHFNPQYLRMILNLLGNFPGEIVYK